MGRIFLVAIFSCMLALSANAQSPDSTSSRPDTSAKKDTPPYLKYPTLPAFNILLTDSVAIFNTFNIPTGRAIAIMLFDPDCWHCRKLTKRLLKEMDSVDNIDFYMITPTHSMQDIRKFADDFRLSKYDNIKVLGRDYEFFFHDYYRVKLVPDIALYDKKKNLIKLFEANATVKSLYEYTH